MSDRTAVERQWEAYFEASGHTVFQHLLMAHRRTFISRALAHWFEVFFPATGVYVEPGAGTSESSARIRPRHRTLVAVGFCHFVLAHLNVLEHRGQADISSLPFANGSVDGIWNLGVMEHFSDDDIDRILLEFRRVLRPEGRILLLWPPWYAPYQLLLRSLATLIRLVTRHRIQFSPHEINLFTTRA